MPCKMFYSSLLSLTSTVGFRDLSRLNRGGFAAGGSFSLMREMEPFAANVHICVQRARVCSYQRLPVCKQSEQLSVYVCGFVKLLV